MPVSLWGLSNSIFPAAVGLGTLICQAPSGDTGKAQKDHGAHHGVGEGGGGNGPGQAKCRGCAISHQPLRRDKAQRSGAPLGRCKLGSVAALALVLEGSFKCLPTFGQYINSLATLSLAQSSRYCPCPSGSLLP